MLFLFLLFFYVPLSYGNAIMKRFLIILFCLTLIPALVSADKYALLIGIDTYSGNNRLNGCVNDAKLMQKLLTERFDFPAANVKLLTDGQATRSKIGQTFHSHLIRQAKSGDVVVFYYSGHGTWVRDFNGDESDDEEESLVPIDFSGLRPKSWLTDDQLGVWLAKIKTDNVTVILDACHSGTGTRGSELIPKTMDAGFGPSARSRGVRVENKANFSLPDMNHVLIAGCAPDQLSFVSRHKAGSVLTVFLYEVLVQATAHVTFEYLMNQLVPLVEDYVSGYFDGRTQSPQLEGNYANRPVFASLETPITTTPVVEDPPPVTPTTPDPQQEPESEAVTYHDFDLTLTTDKDSYHDGEQMVVTVQAERDCYLRLYHVSADMEVQLIFPNKWQQDNHIKAGQTVTIPANKDDFQFTMSKPYGMEIIKAVASTKQFDDLVSADWKQTPFKSFGKMPLSDMNSKLRVEEKTRVSQAVSLYRVGK
ncbi:MAG: hypothetical protein B6244_06110 [Candidatus Cloacimonetes bacterium 4572_55]|nr:MAG: hypothetical protein B6244_06110 [Candidatus Cloacimonetes bacterium 4572_55]